MRHARVIACVAAAAVSVSGAVVATASGERLVTYTAGRNHTHVWLSSMDAAFVDRLGGGQQSQISPNGEFVAAALENRSGPALRIYRTSGGRSADFYNLATNAASPLAWSSDSRYLAVKLGQGLAVIDTTTMTSTWISRRYVSGASFAPRGKSRTPDELVYGFAGSLRTHARVNLWKAAPNGTHRRRITRNGRSLNPVWSRKGILFDRERLRGPSANPELQIWLKHGSHYTKITHRRTPKLQSGLVPIGVSASGNRVLAELRGQDTSYAYRVQISPRRVHAIRVHGQLVQGAAISRNGRRLLVDHGAFQGRPPSHGTVEAVNFFGGHLRKLARGAWPSWNR